MNEQRLAAPPHREHEDRQERGEKRLRNRRRFFIGKRIGDVHRRARVHHDLLRISAPREKGHRPIAVLPTEHFPSDLGHNARAFEAENVRCADRRRIVSFALQQIGAIDSRCDHRDANVVFAEAGTVDLAE